MQKIQTIDDVLKRIEGIRDSMEFNEELFPIVSDLFHFLKDMIPLLMEANVSIKEGTDHLPTAQDNLHQVTETTELATNEVLDKVENISQSLEKVKEMVLEGRDAKEQINKLDEIINESNEIVFAFQFQDITTQQLEHTHRILNAVYNKFGNLFSSFEKMRKNSDLGSDVALAIENEFEKERLAVMNNGDDFRKHTEDKMHHNTGFSQADIDKFFKSS